MASSAEIFWLEKSPGASAGSFPSRHKKSARWVLVPPMSPARMRFLSATFALVTLWFEAKPNHGRRQRRPSRSEEHTSELQSQSNLVCRLLLEKKKKTSRDNLSRYSTDRNFE